MLILLLITAVSLQSKTTEFALAFVPQPARLPPHGRKCFKRRSCTLMPFERQAASESLSTNDSPDLLVEDAEQLLFSQLYQSPSSPKPSKSSFVAVIESWLAIPSPARAECVLDRMEESYQPSGRLYERIVNAWCLRSDDAATVAHNKEEAASAAAKKEQGDNEAQTVAQTVAEVTALATTSALRALRVLNRMEQLHTETGDVDFRPAISTYTSVMNALKRSAASGTATSASTVKILDKIQKSRDSIYLPPSDSTLRPIKCDEDVLNVLQKLKNGQHAATMLRFCSKTKNDRRNKSTRGSIEANTLNFNIIINELAKSGKPWAGQAAQDILDYMIRQSTSSDITNTTAIKNTALKPDIITINGCIDAWSRSQRPDAAQRAERILEKLNTFQSLSPGLLLDVAPNTITYNSIIHAWANVGNAARAEEILGVMEELYERTLDVNVKPDIISFSSVLNAWARAASYDTSSVKKAEAILKRMHVQYKVHGDVMLRPNTRCFNAVLNAHANSPERSSGRRAILMLNLMEDMRDRNNGDVSPDTYSYNTVLKALANSVEPNNANRALEILDKMEREYANGNASVKPDTISYNTVIDAFAKSGGRGAGEAAERILNHMTELNRIGDKTVRPDTMTYTALINAWTRSGEKGSARSADRILEKLERSAATEYGKSFASPADNEEEYVKADTSVYNALLNCWAKSCEWGAAQRAEEILRSMEDQYKKGNQSVKPNVRSYTSVLDALAKSQERDAVTRAQEILVRMEFLHESTGDEEVLPNVCTYTTVINCVARSKDKDKAVKANNVLRRMEEQYRRGNVGARPNVMAYNNVLNACAYTCGDDAGTAENAFQIACSVFDEIRTSDHLRPTHVTYGTFLSVCAKLMPESDMRNDLVEAIFQRCCQEGLVSSMVLRQLRVAASSRQFYLKLLQGAAAAEDATVEKDLPIKWTRNVQERERRMRLA